MAEVVVLDKGVGNVGDVDTLAARLQNLVIGNYIIESIGNSHWTRAREAHSDVTTIELIAIDGEVVVVHATLVFHSAHIFGLEQVHAAVTASHKLGLEVRVLECEVAALVVDMDGIRIRLALWDEAHALEAYPWSGLDKYHTLLELAVGWSAIAATSDNHLAAVATLAHEGNGVLLACAAHLADDDVLCIAAVLNLETYSALHAIGHGSGSGGKGWEVGLGT